MRYLCIRIDQCKEVEEMKNKPEKYVCAHCGYTADGRFEGDFHYLLLVPKCLRQTPNTKYYEYSHDDQYVYSSGRRGGPLCSILYREIYSDHGQEDTLAYPAQHGRTIQAAVAEVFERLESQHTDFQSNDHQGIQYKRARHLGGRKIQKHTSFRKIAEVF